MSLSSFALMDILMSEAMAARL